MTKNDVKSRQKKPFRCAMHHIKKLTAQHRSRFSADSRSITAWDKGEERGGVEIAGFG